MTEQAQLLVTQPQIHDPAWVADVMQAGPNGARFDSAQLLLAAADLPAGIVSMYDAVSAARLPAGAPAYAGYVNGLYANIDAVRARFPDAEVVTIAVNTSGKAMYLDVEPGDASPADVPGFIKAGGIGFYCSASQLQACIDALKKAGIDPATVRKWSAHWIGRHICGPTTCGYPQADGTQYVSTAGWDESAVEAPAFFTAPAAPPPPPPVPVWQEWQGDGHTPLPVLAARADGQTSGSVLGATFVKYGAQLALEAWLDDIFAGHANPVTTPLPVGAKLWVQLPAPPPPPPPPPPAPSGLPAWQTALYARLPDVRLGDQDKAGQVPWVRQVQLLLEANGITTVTVDGDFGPQTQAGLEEWQAKAGLLKTGWADPVTWETLVSGKVGAVLPVVAEGSTDKAAVRRVQALCNAHGESLGIDGVFGAGTKAGVVAVQKVYITDAAKQDGVVGPVTWSLLAAHSLP